MWKINGDDRIPCQTETTTGNVKLISSDAHNKLLEESILKHKRIWKKLSQYECTKNIKRKEFED